MDIGVRDGLSIFSGERKIGGLKVTGHGRITVPFPIPDGIYEIYRTYDPRIDEIKNKFAGIPPLSGTTKIERSRFEPKITAREKKKADLSFYVSSLKVLDAVVRYADRIYFEQNGETDAAEEACVKGGKEFAVILPRFSPADDDRKGSVMIHNPALMPTAPGRRVYGSHHMNMFNSMFPNALYQTTLSVELSRNEIRTICSSYPGRLEQMAFGRIELMATRDPEMASGRLTDERGCTFPVYRDGRGLSHILNSADLLLLEHLGELESFGIDSFGIDLRKRPVELASKVAKAFYERDASKKNAIREMCSDITYGHYARGV
jgi:putative protease